MSQGKLKDRNNDCAIFSPLEVLLLIHRLQLVPPVWMEQRWLADTDPGLTKQTCSWVGLTSSLRRPIQQGTEKWGSSPNECNSAVTLTFTFHLKAKSGSWPRWKEPMRMWGVWAISSAMHGARRSPEDSGAACVLQVMWLTNTFSNTGDDGSHNHRAVQRGKRALAAPIIWQNYSSNKKRALWAPICPTVH